MINTLLLFHITFLNFCKIIQLLSKYSVKICSKGEQKYVNRALFNGEKLKAISLIIFVYVNDLDNKTFIKALSTVPIFQLKREAMSGVTTREYDIALINMYNKSSFRKIDVNNLSYIKNTHKC